MTEDGTEWTNKLLGRQETGKQTAVRRGREKKKERGAVLCASAVLSVMYNSVICACA
jgi:hypothetical protein